MKTRRLGHRREQVLALVPCRRVVADIGSGDGQLAVELVLRRCARRVIATEKREAPRMRVASYVEARGLGDRIEVRLGDGLLPLNVGEAEVAVLAGMGALTMRDILQQAPSHLASLELVVLQPLNDVSHLRRWLWEQELGIAHETLVEEKGRLYPVMLLRPDGPPSHIWEELGDLNFELGSYLISSGHPGLEHVLSRLERQCDAVLSDFKGKPVASRLRRQWDERQARIKEARRLWQKHVK